MTYSKCHFLWDWSFISKMTLLKQLLKTEKLKPLHQQSLICATPGSIQNLVRQQYLKIPTMQFIKITSVVLYQSLGKQSRKNLITLTKNKEQKLVEMQLETGLRGQQTVSWLNGQESGASETAILQEGKHLVLCTSIKIIQTFILELSRN